MLVLAFSDYDSFFVNDNLYQIIPSDNPSVLTLRRQNGEFFSIENGSQSEIFPDCNVTFEKLAWSSGGLKLKFDAPKSIGIERLSSKKFDDHRDEIATPNISERTIDQILEEEFLVNPDFAGMFIAKCFSGSVKAFEQLVATHRSARQVQSGGDESDLILIFENAGLSFALLIENKINASKQILQPERYIERGISGMFGELWDVFETCLIAPGQYLAAKRGQDYYHNYVSHEEISEMLENTLPDRKRREFRKRQFELAIQKKKAFERAPDIPEAVNFVEKIGRFSKEKLPQLEFDTGHANNKVLWFYYSRKEYPDGLVIILKKDVVTAEFKMAKCGKLIEGREQFFKDNGYDFLMAKSGKSCTIRKSVDPINCLRAFEQQRENLENCMNHIADMDQFLRTNVINLKSE